MEPLEEEDMEITTPIVAVGHGFMIQENSDTFRILIFGDSMYGQMGATCCEWNILHFISCGFHQRSWLSQNHSEMRQ